MPTDAQWESLLAAWDDARYPQEFLSTYTLMECLSERGGIDTFLAQDRSGARYIVKCCDKSVWKTAAWSDLPDDPEGAGLPRRVAAYENDAMAVIVREYVEGTPLQQYARENALSEAEIVAICARLCDLLGQLHHRENPIIHRDVKPQNIIVKPDGDLALIDFDIARVYRRDSETDTMFFGTPAYAPPEQYGFSQTDARTDIYALGVLLRFLLTGSTRENKNVRVYRPLQQIIEKCTSFSPKDRFSDVSQVKRALQRANPRSQGLRLAARIICGVLAAAALVFAGVGIYRRVTYTPFTRDAIPGYMSDAERVADALEYLRTKYGTDMFDDSDRDARMGDVRRAMIALYGLDAEYVNRVNDGVPVESEDFFLPWPVDNDHPVSRSVMAYAAVKAHDPGMVADWSSIKDDNGYYPGVRVADAFAERTGLLTGVNRPEDITLGEMALILANTDRIFDAAKKG